MSGSDITQQNKNILSVVSGYQVAFWDEIDVQVVAALKAHIKALNVALCGNLPHTSCLNSVSRAVGCGNWGVSTRITLKLLIESKVVKLDPSGFRFDSAELFKIICSGGINER